MDQFCIDFTSTDSFTFFCSNHAFSIRYKCVERSPVLKSCKSHKFIIVTTSIASNIVNVLNIVH